MRLSRGKDQCRRGENVSKRKWKGRGPTNQEKKTARENLRGHNSRTLWGVRYENQAKKKKPLILKGWEEGVPEKKNQNLNSVNIELRREKEKKFNC